MCPKLFSPMSNRKSKMSDVSSGRRKKRKLAPKAPKGPSDSPKAILLNSSLLLLEVPADTNTSFPVWDALRSLKVGVTWTVKPYGISINLTPLPVKQEDITASCERENSSSVAETSSLQLQIQNTSCVLLTVSHSCLPTPPHTNQSNQSLVNPISVSLPLLITHSPQGYQPGTIATIKPPHAIQPPTSVSGDRDVEPKRPDLLSFHTKVSPDVRICDNFLLGACDAGKRCKMHHTPYPFHWQLWSIKTHQWIDLSPRAQVLLERSYCCAEQSDVTLIDKQTCQVLDFETMELDDLSEYDAVRRLTNSESVETNPHFPSKSKIYWCEGMNFKEYSAVTLFELKCSFSIGKQKYEVDFTSMTQTRISTGFQRQICCRPAYRSPESMYPHLKFVFWIFPFPSVASLLDIFIFSKCLLAFRTGIPSDFTNCEPNAAAASRSIKRFFHKNLPETKVDIISIQQIQNLLHWDKYQRQKTHMQKHHSGAEGPLERHLFHGTTKVASESICLHGFDPRVAGLNGHSHGFGSYFATNALMSHEYTEANESNEVGCMFLAKVLVGRVCLGKHNYRRPPSAKVSLYDACVDNKPNPQMFIVFDSCQCYPYYLIKYKKLSQEITIHD
uniref:TCDD-inducible poly [ADP-ribose] polymerase-like n=1 Tax=Poecilia reticulata TaxID=8081 RepID=A0A3P9QH12_POERE